jgi:Fe-S cluster biogenesis protein NfuA
MNAVHHGKDSHLGEISEPDGVGEHGSLICGDIELVDIKGNLVYCTLSGACQGCPAAATTLKLRVEKTLKDLVDERLHVIAM